MCLKNLSFKNVSCAKQWQIPIVLQSAEKKKRLCTEPSIQSMKFIKKEIHFRATISFLLSLSVYFSWDFLFVDSFDAPFLLDFISLFSFSFCFRRIFLVDFPSVCIQMENLTEILPGLYRPLEIQIYLRPDISAFLYIIFPQKYMKKTLQCIELASFCYLINATVDTHWKMPNRKIRNVFAVLFSLSFSFLHVNQISNK